MSPLPPGAVIGILGGGQLGRMLSGSAARLGFATHIFTDEKDSPASRVSARTTIAAYDDAAALQAFAADCHVITTEFENIPVTALRQLEAMGATVRPSASAVEVAQDRLVEKTFLRSVGVETAPFAPVSSLEDLHAALTTLSTPAILKTRRFGYDGKGQVRLAAPNEADAAWAAIGAQPAILEGLVAFTAEVSVILARGADGAMALFDVCQNHHEGGILRTTRAPAQIPPTAAAAAVNAARAVATRLDYVGVLALELFVTAGGDVLANEMAPRVHNSGHWTHEACLTSQFEQHIRAVAGWPLGPADRIADAVMTNLIGEEAQTWAAMAGDPTARLTLYGKNEVRSGRKMGHVTRLTPRS